MNAFSIANMGRFWRIGRRFLRAVTRILGVFPGYTIKITPPDLGDLYRKAAAKHHENRIPVIAIPGILGSKLVDPQSGRNRASRENVVPPACVPHRLDTRGLPLRGSRHFDEASGIR